MVLQGTGVAVACSSFVWTVNTASVQRHCHGSGMATIREGKCSSGPKLRHTGFGCVQLVVGVAVVLHKAMILVWTSTVWLGAKQLYWVVMLVITSQRAGAFLIG